MKRSEKEAEVRKLLETPGAVVQLPAGITLAEVGNMGTEQLVQILVGMAIPVGGWEPEPIPPEQFPVTLSSRPWGDGATKSRRYITIGDNYFTLPPEIADEVLRRWEEYPRLKAELETIKDEIAKCDDPDDPLTVGLQKLAAEEIAVLVRDAAKVTREETIRQMESWYTREEFVAAEVELSLGVEEPEDIDPDAFAAIRRRAEWNAQAAERAGVVWRSVKGTERLKLDEPIAEQGPTGTGWSKPDGIRRCSYEVLCEVGRTNYWPLKITADGQCWIKVDVLWEKLNDAHPAMKELARRLVAEHGKNWTEDWQSLSQGKDKE